MKKALILLFLLSTLGLSAQNHYLGIKAGGLFSNINTNSDFLKDTKSRQAFAGGLTYEYQFAKLFNVCTGLIYSQKGYKKEVLFANQIGQPINEGFLGFYYNYICIPLKGGIRFGNNLSFFVNLGVAPSILASASVNPIDIEGENPSNITDKVNNIDIYGLIEIGGSIKFAGRFVAFISTSYQHSFTSFSTDAHMSGTDTKLYAYGVDIGIRYALKK